MGIQALVGGTIIFMKDDKVLRMNESYNIAGMHKLFLAPHLVFLLLFLKQGLA